MTSHTFSSAANRPKDIQHFDLSFCTSIPPFPRTSFYPKSFPSGYSLSCLNPSLPPTTRTTICCYCTYHFLGHIFRDVLVQVKGELDGFVVFVFSCKTNYKWLIRRLPLCFLLLESNGVNTMLMVISKNEQLLPNNDKYS